MTKPASTSAPGDAPAIILDRCVWLPIFRPACAAADLAPVRPLGIFERYLFFADPHGQPVALTLSGLDRRNIVSLFDGDLAQLARLFPAGTRARAFHLRLAVDTLIALAADAGDVDPTHLGFEVGYRFKLDGPLDAPPNVTLRNPRKTKRRQRQ